MNGRARVITVILVANGVVMGGAVGVLVDGKVMRSQVFVAPRPVAGQLLQGNCIDAEYEVLSEVA